MKMVLPTLAFCLVVAFVSVVSQTWAQETKPSVEFRVSVEMVSLSVTVFDEKQRLVTDLEQENFAIYEDGVRQQIRVFSKENLPLRMVILLDTSASMGRRMELAQEAAVRFAHTLKEGDQVKVIEFNSHVRTLSEFTTDFEKVEKAIRETKAEGATSLYEALYIALHSLSRRRQGDERQSIVVLSDGNDTRSLVTFEEVRELARKTDVLIYTISLRGSKDDLKKQKYSDAKYELEKLSGGTGGSFFAPGEVNDLADVYDQIATELKSQFNIVYVPTNTKADGAWRSLQLRVDREGAVVRSRIGYYAPSM